MSHPGAWETQMWTGTTGLVCHGGGRGRGEVKAGCQNTPDRQRAEDVQWRLLPQPWGCRGFRHMSSEFIDQKPVDTSWKVATENSLSAKNQACIVYTDDIPFF